MSVKSSAGQLEPGVTIVRRLLVAPLVVTLTPPQTACGGTVTVRDVAVAAVIVPATRPPAAAGKSTVLFAGTGSKPKPVSVTGLPGTTL
jgi:hypothetical protein